MQTIGRVIKHLRKNNVSKLTKMSQTDLGNLLGAKKSYICKVEKGDQIPRLSQIQKFADALGVDLMDILALALLDVSEETDELSVKKNEMLLCLREKYSFCE